MIKVEDVINGLVCVNCKDAEEATEYMNMLADHSIFFIGENTPKTYYNPSYANGIFYYLFVDGNEKPYIRYGNIYNSSIAKSCVDFSDVEDSLCESIQTDEEFHKFIGQ